MKSALPLSMLILQRFTSGAYNGYLDMYLKASSFWRKSKSLLIITCYLNRGGEAVTCHLHQILGFFAGLSLANGNVNIGSMNEIAPEFQSIKFQTSNFIMVFVIKMAL